MVIQALANELAHSLESTRQRVVVAESCTGGLLASTLTNIAGSSSWFEGGYVTYTLQAKSAMLGISASTLQRHGAVSQPVAEIMANNALARSSADYSVAVTGLAGPDGDGSDTPVGTIWVGLARTCPHWIGSRCYYFIGSREEIRNAAATVCIKSLLEMCGDNARRASRNL